MAQNKSTIARFPTLHPSSVPAAQRGTAKQKAQQDARDRANARRVLRGHSVVQAKQVQDIHGSAGLPTVSELMAQKAKKNPTKPPTVSELHREQVRHEGPTGARAIAVN